MLNAKLLGVVPEDDTIIVAQNHGESMMGQKSGSEICYQNICRRILGEDIEIPDYLKEKKKFLGFLWKKQKEPAVKNEL